MRIDVFEFLEGLIRGLVLFIYNFVETIWQLTTAPRWGVLKLYRASADPRRKQLGGLTFLFLLFFLAAIARTPLLLLALGFGDVSGSLLKALNATPRIGSDALWAPVVGALAATMIVDAPCRLLLRWRWPRRPVRRRMLLAGFEYLLTWPILFLVVGRLAALWKDAARGGTYPNPVIDLGLLAVGVALALLVAHPAAGWLVRMVNANASRHGGRGLSRRVAEVATLALTAIAMTAGERLGDLVGDQAAHDANRGAPFARLEPIALHCALAGPAAGAPYAELALVNLVSYPVALDPAADLRIELFRSDAAGVRLPPSRPARVAAVDGGPARLIMFAGKEGKVLRLSLDLGARPDPTFDHCGVTGGEGEVKLAPLTSWLERQSKW